MNAVLTEKHLGVKASLEIVTTRTAHIFHYDVGYLARLNICYHPLPRRTFKSSSAKPVIGIEDTVFIALLCGIAFEVSFLVDDGVAASVCNPAIQLHTDCRYPRADRPQYPLDSWHDAEKDTKKAAYRTQRKGRQTATVTLLEKEFLTDNGVGIENTVG